MTENEFFAAVVTGLVLVYWAGFTWGKYVKIFKELGRSA